RRRHTRSDRDWSSDVCSSDLFNDRLQPIFGRLAPLSQFRQRGAIVIRHHAPRGEGCEFFEEGCVELIQVGQQKLLERGGIVEFRSEERRVGKEWRSRWWVYH